MYRDHEHARGTVVVRYRPRRLRPGFIAAAVVVLGLGLAALGGPSMARVTCAEGTCTVRHDALFARDATTVPAASVRGYAAREVVYDDGKRWVDLGLRVDDGVVDVASERRRCVTPEEAAAAEERLQAFLRGTSATYADTFRSPLTGMILCVLFALVLLAMSGHVLVEQLRQLRAVRIVVDRDRGVVTALGEEVRFEDVIDVTIEDGPAFVASLKKNEYVEGHRLALLAKDGTAWPACRVYRAGGRGVHEAARARVLAAMGREG